MREPLVATVIASIFLLLGLWHFYLASTSFTHATGAVPTRDGKPLFVPSSHSTMAVGIILILFAGLVAATAGLIPSALPQAVLKWLSFALALGLLARAVGEFKHVGFFKTVHDSRFARLDSWVYSPLCLALSAGVAWVASR